MKKIVLDTEIELTEREQSIFKAGVNHGWFQGVLIGVVSVLVVIILLIIFSPTFFTDINQPR